MKLKNQTSQVVLMRRCIDSIVDGIANEIATRRGRRTRTFITVFGDVLSTLDKILKEVESLQYRNNKTISADLRKKIIEAEEVFASAMLQKHFEELKTLL